MRSSKRRFSGPLRKMTDCISHLDFGYLSRQALVGNFDGGDISSDGGLMLLAEVDQALGLTAQMAARLADSRQAGKVRHSVHDLPPSALPLLELGSGPVGSSLLSILA